MIPRQKMKNEFEFLKKEKIARDSYNLFQHFFINRKNVEGYSFLGYT